MKKNVISILAAVIMLMLAFSAIVGCNSQTTGTIDKIVSETGIELSGGSFSEGSVLKAESVDLDTDQGKEALNTIKGYEYNTFKPVYIFDISVLKDNVKVQPNGKVKVSIPMTAALASYKDVLHIKDDGGVEKLSATYADGKISFETDSFSIFVLVEPAMTNHLHDFSDEWSFDETNHWHAATCEHTAEKSNLGEHEFDDGTVITPATEKADGEIKYTCTVCGYEKTGTISTHTHVFSGEWSQSETHHWHACTIEDCEATEDLAEHYYDLHGWWDIRKPATETETGLMVRVCIGCKYEDSRIIPKYDPNHKHTYSETWTTDEYYHWRVATCAHVNEHADEAEHSWNDGEIIKTATLEEDGIITYTCTVCSATKQQTYAHTHTFSEDWSKNETYHWHAATCGHEQEVDSKSEHTWNNGEITKPATSTADGVKTYTCTICGATKEENVVYVPHTHTFSEYWSKDDDYHWYACTGDDCTEVDDKAKHTWGEANVVRDPSHIDGGRTDYTCTVCGKTKQVTTPHEHIYGDWQFAATYHWQLANCGYYTGHNGIRGPQSAHVFVEGFCKDCGIKDPSVASIGLEFTLQEDGTYFVSGIGTCTDIHLVIPSTHEEKAVTGIANAAFRSKGALRSVYLPDSVKTVGNEAFKSCNNLNSVRFPDDMSDIGESAFSGCKLYTLTLPTKGLSEIKKYAFSSNYEYLLNIYIPDNIKIIGESAFNYCRAVVELRLPETMESLGASCFEDLQAITSITIPKGIKELPKSVFANCYGLTEVTIPNWIETIGERAFDGCKNLTTVHLSEGLTAIEEYAFDSTKLTSVTIPSSISELKVGVFNRCSALSEVILPEGLITIGKLAFANCSSLVEITLPSGLTTLGEQSFENSALTSIVVPEKIKVININTFSNCKKLTSVTLPEGLLKIDERAFYNCTSLKEISIPNGVTEISIGAFQSCSALTTVNIPTSLIEISSNAFYNTKINNIVIPDSVTSIGGYAFYGNAELESVTFGKNIKSIESSAFENCAKLATISLPAAVESIGSRAFAGCKKITAINLPSSLVVIEYAAFIDCTNLTTVTFPSGIKQLEQSVFKNTNVSYTEFDNACYLGNAENPYLVLVQAKDKTATSCTIHSSTVVIAGRAFYDSAITEITIPDSVKVIGHQAFGSKLEKLYIDSIDDWCMVKSKTEKTYAKINDSYEYYWGTESAHATAESRARFLVYTAPYDVCRDGFLSSYTKV